MQSREKQLLTAYWIQIEQACPLKAAVRQPQLLGFLIKRGKTTSRFCSPCFSQQFAVPALYYLSEVEQHLQLPPLRSAPPQSFLEKANVHCSRPSLIPPVPKPIQINIGETS